MISAPAYFGETNDTDNNTQQPDQAMVILGFIRLNDMVRDILVGLGMKIHLPYPVTVNRMYANLPGRGRIKTKQYRTWQKQAQDSLWGQKTDHVPGNVQVTISVKRPDNRKRDIDNLAKGILDFLVKNKMIDDDRHIQRLTIEWVYDGSDGATIEIRRIK